MKGVKLGMLAGQTGLSLLFAKGKRPSANDIARLLASSDMSGAATHISYQPNDESEGWLELLVSGLTFDLSGLSASISKPVPPFGHGYGIDRALAEGDLEAVTLVSSQHISGGFAMIPVVQAMAGLAAHIALPLEVKAVCWHPARSWMEPQYFSRIALNWLLGGAFPALGLTALGESEDGVTSEGLSFFAGQELHVDARGGEPIAETAKLAVRFIDYIVSNGAFKQSIEFEGPEGDLLQVDVSANKKLATVRREI